MYKLTADGTIIFPDGSTLPVPYEDEAKYLKYAAWVQAGNSPEVVDANA